MNTTKCDSCGLVNYATNETCRRCQSRLHHEPLAVEAASSSRDDGRALPTPQRGEGGLVAPKPRSGVGGRSFGRWVLWILGVVTTIVTTAYASLLLTSEGVTTDERRSVNDAIRVLERAGFTNEASALAHLASFRRTDNWWNRYVGHQTAFAATNFPFAVVTLYPAFFRFPVDDTERASILLHEAEHLFGGREEEALQRVWEVKQQLGWTASRYGETRVWKNTQEWTRTAIPAFFSCGPDGASDCFE